MSSYTIRFNTEAPEAIVDYLGEVGAMLTMRPMTPAQARFAWSFAGVQGFPVECWINRYLEDKS